MDIFTNLKKQIVGKDLKIVFPEGNDRRILRAAVRLAADGLLQPVLLGKPEEIQALADYQRVNLGDITIIDPTTYPAFDEMVTAFVARRKGKATEEDARKILLDVNYFGTMLTYMGIVDGMVSGAVHSTGETVRPALQIVKTKPGVSRTSGAFLMVRGSGEEKYLFSDCAINVNPTAQQLAEIAVESAATAKLFGMDPKVALLSFSSKGSAEAPEVDKVVEATAIAQNIAPTIYFDGELQFDAAYVDTVADKKAPGSPVAGQANVFVFPELQSGNIGYKIAQRFGNFEAIGPILQGLNKPISDLSRGCNEEDVYKLAIITAGQSLTEED